MKNPPSSIYVSVRISPTQNEKLESLMRQTKKSKSLILRNFIDKGLYIDSFAADEERMLLAIRKALALELKQPIERLAAIGAKGTHVSAGTFFMAIQIAKLLDNDQDKINQYASKSRRLGIQYLKEPNISLDTFIDDTVNKL